MKFPHLIVPAALLFVSIPACDTAPTPDPKAAAAADAKAKEDAAKQKRLEARKQERLAKAAAEKQKIEDIKNKVVEVSVIPEGTKIPKKAKDACEEVVTAQEGFMKKFHGDMDPSALTTQLGMLRKQCNEMGKPKVAMCQKFALDATTELTKGAINDYLPACLAKYGE